MTGHKMVGSARGRKLGHVGDVQLYTGWSPWEGVVCAKRWSASLAGSSHLCSWISSIIIVTMSLADTMLRWCSDSVTVSQKRTPVPHSPLCVVPLVNNAFEKQEVRESIFSALRLKVRCCWTNWSQLPLPCCELRWKRFLPPQLAPWC